MKPTSEHEKKNVKTFGERDEMKELEWQKYRIKDICKILKTIPNKSLVADVGCMSGMATQLYAEAGVSEMHGFDFSEASLEKLKQKGFQGFYWNAEGGKCPQPNDTYDVVIASEIIEHLMDTDTFAEELHRILKPGGFLLVSTPNLASWYNRIRLVRGLAPRCYPGTSVKHRKDPMIDNHHIRVNILSEWRHFFEQHAFEVKQVFGSSHLQALQGGLYVKVLKWIDRLACKRPSLAVNIILLAQKK